MFIRRSNDVIPEVLGVAQELDGINVPKPQYCPSCGSKLEEEGANLFCPNEYGCTPQIVGRITHYASKDCMDIDGISEKTIELLHKKTGLNSVEDLYKLKLEDFADLEGFKDKKPEKILKSIAKSKDVELSKFIAALGIPNVGKKWLPI